MFLADIENADEILLDIKMFQGPTYNELTRYLGIFGITDYKSLIGQTVFISDKPFKVVGFTDRGFPVS